MKQTQLLMNMPITVEILDRKAKKQNIDAVFDYFKSVEERFSFFKKTSELTQINNGEISKPDYSPQMKEVFVLSEQTKKQTNGYFDISTGGKINPSGLVKGWAIFKAAEILRKEGFRDYYIEAGGDVEARGGKLWRVGIRNPFNSEEIVKVIGLKNRGMATSGIYMRGLHIYNPKSGGKKVDEIVSLSVIGPNIYEADRFATGAFAMGQKSIEFIENLEGFEGYMIDKNGIATQTSGFEKYVIDNA
jgi:thiamine biosynthesis lipoprotein